MKKATNAPCQGVASGNMSSEGSVEGNGLKSSEKIGKSSLENLFEFVNKNIDSLPESEFIGLLHTYTRFVCQYESKYPFLGFRKKHDEYTDGLLTPTPSQALSKRKVFFVKLQSHLRSRLLSIIDAEKPDALQEPQLFIEMAGTRKVLIYPNADSFLDGFWPKAVKPEGSPDLDSEKSLAELILSDMIQDFGLKPSHFRKCRRCENLFYQRTEKDRTYCSIRCGNAARQDKHSKKKKAKKKRTQKVAKA